MAGMEMPKSKGGIYMVYQWKYGLGTHGVKAQKAGEYFESLEQRDGEIKPETVVDEARPSEAVLHPVFEWDDSKAAEKYRTEQAKSIIGNIVVVQERPDKMPIITRAVVNVKPAEEVGTPCKTDDEISYGRARYQMVQTALQSPEMSRTVLQNAKTELRRFMSKYRQVNELKRLFAEIEVVLNA